MNKIFLLFLIVYSFNAFAVGQLITDWLKAGTEKQPRYFLKNYPMQICGSLEKVNATLVKNHPLNFNIKLAETYSEEFTSCLEAEDSIDGSAKTRYEILEKNGNDFYIKRVKVEGEPAGFFPVLKIPANSISTFWAMRYPQGEIMIEGPPLCEHMYDWRKTPRRFDLSLWMPSNPTLPFPVKSEGEAVRYHVFEYHMGCGT